jgi:hypothetical protein
MSVANMQAAFRLEEEEEEERRRRMRKGQGLEVRCRVK